MTVLVAVFGVTVAANHENVSVEVYMSLHLQSGASILAIDVTVCVLVKVVIEVTVTVEEEVTIDAGFLETW